MVLDEGFSILKNNLYFLGIVVTLKFGCNFFLRLDGLRANLLEGYPDMLKFDGHKVLGTLFISLTKYILILPRFLAAISPLYSQSYSFFISS